MAKLVARAWLALASDQNAMITANPMRVPKASTSFPPPRYINA